MSRVVPCGAFRHFSNAIMVAPLHPLFPLGRVVATPCALAALEEAGQSTIEIVHRHVQGDWGDLGADDKQANVDAIKHGDRIFSAYELKSETRIYVITEADRSSTCVLLTSEY